MHDANISITDNRGMNAALSCAPSAEVADCLEMIITFMMDAPHSTYFLNSSNTNRTSMESSKSRVSSQLETIFQENGEDSNEPEVNGTVDNTDSDTYF